MMRFLFISIFLSCSHFVVSKKTTFDVFCQGNCNVDVTPSGTVPGVVLMGGGEDTDEAFIWQIGNAKGGDFVVIRATGTDAYNPYIYDLSVQSGATLNSVRTIIFNSKEATNDNEVLTLLRNAEAVFIAGGDQSDYVNMWIGTPVQSLLQEKIQNITIGGTSAGCMVESNWIYSAETGSVDSAQALANPYHKYITFSDKFLSIPYLETTLADTHFVTRDRMGRLMAFVARVMKDVDAVAPVVGRGIGIDEHTALLMNPTNGDVSIVGIGTAYVCTSDHKAAVCESGKELTFEGVSCVRLDAKSKDRFSFSTWSGDGVKYVIDVVNGVFTTDRYGPNFSIPKRV